MAQYLDKDGLIYYHNKLKTTILDKKLDATTAENTYYPKAGGTIGGSVVITGDLTVNGTQHINNTENLNVKTPMIYSNADGGTLAQLGGIGIKKNATDVYGIVYDPTDDAVKLGLGKSDASGTYTFNTGEGHPIAIRDDSTNITNNHIIKWDSTKKKLVDAGKSIDDINASINAKYTKPSGGIPKSDLDAGVKASLDKADTALQSHQSLDNYAKLDSVNTFAKHINLTQGPEAYIDFGNGSKFYGTYIAVSDNTITFPNGKSGTVALIEDIPTVIYYSAGTHITIGDDNKINAVWPTASDVGYAGINKTGTITGITMNGVSQGTSGVVDLGTVITSHQSLADYAKLSDANTFAKLNTFNSGVQIPNGGPFNIGTKAAEAPWVGIASKENVTATLTHNTLVTGKSGGISDTIGYIATGSFTPTGTNIRNVSITAVGPIGTPTASYNGSEIIWKIYAQTANASVSGTVTYISDDTVSSPAFVSHTHGAAGQEFYALLPPNKSGTLALVEDISNNVSTIPNEDIDKLFV